MSNSFSTKETALFILKSAKPFPIAIFMMFLLGFVWAVDLSLRPYILKVIIDRISQSPYEDVFKVAGIPAAAYAFLTLIYPTFYRLNGYFVDIKMLPYLRKNLAHNSFGLLLKQSFSYYQNNFSGSLSNKINDLTACVPEIILMSIGQFFSRGLALFIAIFTLWQVSGQFAMAMFIWSCIVMVLAVLFGKRFAMLADNWSECGSKITGKIVDSLSNILSVRLFARDQDERSSLDSAIDSAVRAEQKMSWTYFWIWFYFGYSFAIVQVINLYLLLKGREAGWVSVGDFVVVLTINFYIVDVLSQLTFDLSQFSKHWGKATQALRSIMVTPEIQDAPGASELLVQKGEIVFDKIKFQYPNAETLFENKSVIIPQGQKVGLVGYSGGGKSTFVNLILRLFDINDGQITIDGQDIRNVTQESLRAAIAMIPQDPSLFHRTLMENIRYGRFNASDEEVIEAAKRAHAHDFIMQLPEAYNALVGERGVKLSGGQRQRIAIARAILKNAPILILDEATSQLDSLTESDIQDSLWELMQNKTTIIIAHRLSTLLHMDRILVFDQGKIVEDGTQSELLAKNGLFKTLWDAQVGGFLQDDKGGDL